MNEKQNEMVFRLWNKAVSEVGGMRNTASNFANIASKFKQLCFDAGLTEEIADKEIADNWLATCRFMVDEVSE